MPVVKLTEMYDLSTSLNKIGVIGIHTPTVGILERKWSGFLINYKFFKILSCSVRLACASLLPADPLQISVSGAAIAPQDIMNPILYRAVSNEAWNSIVNRFYRTTDGSNAGGESNSVRFLPNSFPSLSDAQNETLYYALLSEDGWRKAMPQSGLSMSGLKPLVFEVVDTYGNSDLYTGSTSDLTELPPTGPAGEAVSPGTSYMTPSLLRGSARPYPRLPCSRPATSSSVDSGGNLVLNTVNFIPKSYVSCLVLPPSKLKTMYFRMIVDWYVEFQEPCSTVEKAIGSYNATTGGLVYSRSYTFPASTSSMVANPSEDKVYEDVDSTIDSVNVDPVKVMDK